MEDLTGKQLGAYRIVEALGEGGMAMVYKAYQASMDRYVAIKIMHRFFAHDEEFRARFEQEAKVIAKLEHPHIVPIFDFGETDDYTYIVMRFIEGNTLADVMGDQPLPSSQIRQIMAQIGSALDYAHSRGVIHRDVKPSNVLVDGQGNCFLSDFGFAKLLESQTKLSITGSAIGTPTYMSPEQILGQVLDGRSDIYALGIVLYEMATGRTPYKTETPTAMFVKHIHDRLPPPRQFNPDIPEYIERAIFRALAKDPEERFVSMGEFVRALSGTLATPPPIPVTPPPVAPPVPDAPQQRSLLRTGGLIFAIILFTALVFSGVTVGIAAFNEQQQPSQNAVVTATQQAISQPTPQPSLQPHRTATTDPTLAPTQTAQAVIRQILQTQAVTQTARAEQTSIETSTTTGGVRSGVGTIVFRECRGFEGSLTFASFEITSFHAFSEARYTMPFGSYPLRVDWPNNSDLNVNTTVNVVGGTRVIAFGDVCP